MPGTATYLYCILHASRKPATTRAPHGLPNASRPTLSSLAPSFWLVTASIPLNVYGPEMLKSSLRDAQWVTDIALAHEGVVEFFARRAGVTVIPMKLFTMFSSENLAIAETRSRMRQLRQVVKRIAGCEEWGVRITYAPTADEPVPQPRARSGAEFLAAKSAARQRVRSSADAAAGLAERAYTTLSRLAREARRRDDVPDGATAPPLLDAAFLVRADDRTRFKTAIKKLADSKSGTVLSLTGPWPSYNFVDSGSDA